MNITSGTPDIGQLTALHWLLKEKNVSRAAQQMRLSQPAMSRIFSKLKIEFNDPLMVRAGNSYQLTPRGQQLLQQLNQLMPQIHNLWRDEALDLANIEQTIILSGTDMDVVFLSERIHQIRQMAPNIELKIRTSSPRVVDEIIESQIDFALTAFDDERAGLFRQLLMSEKFVVVAGKDCRLDASELDLKTYLAHQHGLFSFAEPIRGKVDTALEQLGVKRNIRLRLPTFLQIPPFLKDANLLFSVPESFAEYLALHFPIKILPLPFEVKPLDIYLYWHERQHHNKLHRWMRRRLLNQLDD